MKILTKTAIIWICYFGTALLCQGLFHVFPDAFFAFPVNVVLLLLLMVCLWVVYREPCFSVFASCLTSFSTTFLLLALFLLSCLFQGLTTFSVTNSWWFVFVLTALIAHLFLVLFRGLAYSRSHKVRFVLIHAGLLLALVGGFWGVPDTYEWRTIVSRGKTVQDAFDKDGNKVRLDDGLQLVSLDATFSESGIPLDYVAKLRTVKQGNNIILKVNHPYRISWKDDLYLESIGSLGTADPSPYCIVQWVRQPWKYVQWTGIWMLIAGSVMLFVQGAQEKKEGRSHDNME